MQDEGYILIAANEHHYLEMAVSAACSLKTNDSRPVALLISGGISVPKHYSGLFDHIVAFDPPPPYDGMFVRRFVLERYSPYKRCMHIDADCMLIGGNINKFWDMFAGRPFGVMAQYQSAGSCYNNGINVDEIVESGLSDGIYVTNWGVFYYEASSDNPVLAKGRELLEGHIAGTMPAPTTYFSRPGQYSDEPLWGLSLALTGEEMPRHDYQGLLQCTSPNTRNHNFDFDGQKFTVDKGGTLGATGEIYHFAAMHPLDGYLHAIAHYRDKQAIALPALIAADSTMIKADNWRFNTAEVTPRLFKEAKPYFKFALDAV